MTEKGQRNEGEEKREKRKEKRPQVSYGHTELTEHTQLFWILRTGTGYKHSHRSH